MTFLRQSTVQRRQLSKLEPISAKSTTIRLGDPSASLPSFFFSLSVLLDHTIFLYKVNHLPVLVPKALSVSSHSLKPKGLKRRVSDNGKLIYPPPCSFYTFTKGSSSPWCCPLGASKHKQASHSIAHTLLCLAICSWL